MPKQLNLIPEAPPLLEDVRVRLDEIKPAEGLAPDSNFIESVRLFGVLQPVILREQRGKLVIVDGRRRVEAARELELGEVPARIVHDNGNTPDVLTLVGNAQRSDNFAKEAEVVEKLLRKGATPHDLYVATGLPPARIRRLMRLAGLEPRLRAAFAAGEIKTATAMAAAKLGPEAQAQLAALLPEGPVTTATVRELRQVGAAVPQGLDLPRVPEVEYDWRPGALLRLRDVLALLPDGHGGRTAVQTLINSLEGEGAEYRPAGKEEGNDGR